MNQISPDEHPPPTQEKKAHILHLLETELALNSKLPADASCPLESSIVRIKTKPHVPYKGRSPPIPAKLAELAQRKISRMLSEGKIEPSQATPYELPFFVLPKLKEGEVVDVRAILDCRPLNQLLQADSFPIPAIKDILTSLAGNTIFSELDLSDAFHRLQVHTDDRFYLTFRFQNRQYRYCRAPMGMTHIPAHFQRTMDSILGNLPFVKTYIDNIIVGSTTVEEHVEHLRLVINLLTKNNLQLNADKCNWGCSEIRILGNVVSSKGLRPDPTKLEALAAWPTPTTGKQVQRLVGFINFIRDFIPNCADLTQPLEPYKKMKHLPEGIRREVGKQFDKIKAAINPNALLLFPDRNKQYAIMVDASNVAIGGVLYQPSSPTEPPTAGNIVAFLSRNLKKYELGYSVYKKELLALVFALIRWRPYLWGAPHPVLVFTDHKPLMSILTQPLNPILQNWLDVVLQFQLQLYHIEGTRNVIADSLSRTISMNQMQVSSPATPEQLRLIEAAHAQGHYGATHIMYQLQHQQGKRWPHQRTHVDDYLQTCVACARRKRHLPRYSPFSLKASKAPFSRLQIDLITSFSQCNILVVVDTFTGFVILRALATKKAREVALTLYQIFCDFGPPIEILSDNGSEFIGDSVALLNAFFKIHRLPSIAYTPQRQGQVERSIQTISSSLRTLLEESPGKWQNLLPLVQLYYNNKIYQTTGVPPFHLLFGRIPHLFKTDESPSVNIDDWQKHLARLILHVFPEIERRIISNKLRNAIDFARRHRMVDNQHFKRKDFVMALDPTVSSKTLPIYKGPYKVIQLMNDHSYLLASLKGMILPKTFAAHHLKPVDIDEKALRYFLEKSSNYKDPWQAEFQTTLKDSHDIDIESATYQVQEQISPIAPSPLTSIPASNTAIASLIQQRLPQSTSPAET